MTIAEILEQAKKLTPAERETLAQQILDMDESSTKDTTTDTHWGKSLNALMDEIGEIEMKYPEIEDPVEWVQKLRADRRKQRLQYLDDNE